jgi:hypothetical protein
MKKKIEVKEIVAGRDSPLWLGDASHRQLVPHVRRDHSD